jgi:CubicO group peptidase (beta-lactamase class C family)
MNRNEHWAGWQRQHAGASPTEQRLAFTRAALQRPPRSPPGTQTAYTSDGYIVAGAMLERLAGLGWEQLVRTVLFEPLGLRSMRYGVATEVSGHEPGWFGRSVIIAPNPAEFGTEPFGAPAGFLRSAVPDLLRYLDFHIQGERGGGRILRQAAFERLHHAVDGEPYALGWETEVRRDEQMQIVEHSVHHGGYTGRSRANIWFVPETQWGTVIVMNHGRGDDSISADIFYALLREFRLLP